jgi:hypothetical protein
MNKSIQRLGVGAWQGILRVLARRENRPPTIALIERAVCPTASRLWPNIPAKAVVRQLPKN